MRNAQVLQMVCPSIIAAMRQSIGTMYSMMSATSTIMPTDTKKMAPKRFFTGDTRCSILCTSTVSDSMLPMTNAPNAAEKPTAEANTTMPKHMARAVMSSVSSFMSFFAFFRKSGMRYMPTTNHNTRKKPNCRMELSICVPSNSLLTARVESITISTMASISSMMSTLSTRLANLSFLTPISSKALKIIVVDDIASIPPRYMQSISLQPKR